MDQREIIFETYRLRGAGCLLDVLTLDGLALGSFRELRDFLLDQREIIFEA